MSYKRSKEARAETIRRRSIRKARRTTPDSGPSLASVESWLNMSELR